MNKMILGNVAEPNWPESRESPSYPCFQYYDHADGMCPAGKVEDAVTNAMIEDVLDWQVALGSEQFHGTYE